MLIVELPFATPFGGNAKFTKPGTAATVSDVDKTAFRFTLPVFELNWASAIVERPAMPSRPATRANRNAARGRRGRSVDSRLDEEVKFRFSGLRTKVPEKDSSQLLNGLSR
jgi:hypothetical protein